jgi:hypothetical protein
MMRTRCDFLPPKLPGPQKQSESAAIDSLGPKGGWPDCPGVKLSERQAVHLLECVYFLTKSRFAL